jgi:hypothetical protein
LYKDLVHVISNWIYYIRNKIFGGEV